MGIAREIQSNMAEPVAGFSKKVEKVVRSTVSEVKRRKKSYKHDLVSSIGSEDRSNYREIAGPEFSDVYVATFAVAEIKNGRLWR